MGWKEEGEMKKEWLDRADELLKETDINSKK